MQLNYALYGFFLITNFTSILAQIPENLCPKGWTFSNGTSFCYLISQQSFSADDAQAYCNSIGGDLASIYAYYERDFVMNFTMDMIVMPWIGLRRNLTSNSWYNLDGTSFLSWWSSGEPSDGNNCVVFRSNSNFNLSMNQEVSLPCYMNQPALCKQHSSVCNGGDISLLIQNKGNITSPGYPIHYFNNLDCFYYLTAASGLYITIYFDPYLVEFGFDRIRVYEGKGNSSDNLIGELRSEDDGRSFESIGNVMTVWFHTDSTVVKNGWMANYEATRGLAPINQTGSSGVLTSPNYPNDYGNFVEQYYYVYGPAGFRVRINVDDFYTEDTRDYLDIFNSTEVFDNSTLVARLTGYYVASWNYTFPSNTFGMRFMSDWLVSYRGFHATWTIVEN